MVLEKLIVGPLGTNCYIIGSDLTKEVFIIDPGGDSKIINKKIFDMNLNPIGLLLTHGHFDHIFKAEKLIKKFNIPLMYSKKEFDSGLFDIKKADKWLEENQDLVIGDITLKVLETPGHSPGSLSFYSNDIREFKEYKGDGIIFTGDLLFRRSIGRTDIKGGDKEQIIKSIKNKIIYNSIFTDNYIIFPGHMGVTTLKEEKNLNLFRKSFL
ncbi:MAG: MBL fold metallo-hydrolase [Candidatus Lokiarchaeota archaeon]|nr:MBL fold metallo-hydrolase [Candidatus Lokiarchaeota archaeon]